MKKKVLILGASGMLGSAVYGVLKDKYEGLNERALKAGAKGYLQKPFNDQALVDLINIAAENKKERRTT